jgi:hypothetical protein
VRGLGHAGKMGWCTVYITSHAAHEGFHVLGPSECSPRMRELPSFELSVAQRLRGCVCMSAYARSRVGNLNFGLHLRMVSDNLK